MKVGKSQKWNKTFFLKKNLPMNKLCLLPLLLFTFGLFQASNFYSKLMRTISIPVNGAGIRTHNFQNISLIT